MAKNTNAACKKCRREGEKLFLKSERCLSPKCAIIKRNFPPGVHGAKGRGRLTPYGVQLRQKQKAKKIYGLREKQFSLYYQKAMKQKGNTNEILGQLLEMRLDNVIYKLGFGGSHRSARQLVSHGHFLINNKKVDIPSYQLKVGSVITVRTKSKELVVFKNFKDSNVRPELPSWLAFDKEKMEAKVTSKPQAADLPKNIDMTLIIEYYSR